MSNKAQKQNAGAAHGSGTLKDQAAKVVPDNWPIITDEELEAATEAILRTQKSGAHQLRTELVFNGPLAHLLPAAACTDGQSVAEWCQKIIKDNVKSYMEFEVTYDRDPELTDAEAGEAEKEDAAVHAELTAEADFAAREVTVPTDRFVVVLSKPTSDLVRWYCALMRHQPEFTIDGVVHDALDSAKDAYENGGDDSFDLVLRSTLDATVLNHLSSEQQRQAEARPRLL